MFLGTHTIQATPKRAEMPGVYPRSTAAHPSVMTGL
jgi:hypothetical protein